MATLREAAPTLRASTQASGTSATHWLPYVYFKQDLRNCHKRGRGAAVPSAKQLDNKHRNIRT
ncbi:hypothetical protein, partial [Nostoc sp.]|uniref:hypothetical protein n=1 Tax=Nostoc sp. TaxID=1180 RepID=UPI002FF4D432